MASFIYQMVGIMNDSREHILQVSLQLFLQKGYKEVTMKDIVDKTGLSKGAFYHYFNSKEQVFTEVIHHFIISAMVTDYSLYTQDTLKGYYSDILDAYEKSRVELARLIPENKESTFNNNHYYLLFDAMRMLPDFKQQHLEEQKEELKAWKRVVAMARKSGEIRTLMTDEQVAKLFIYLSDGANINLIMTDQINKKRYELKGLWESLYDTLKA